MADRQDEIIQALSILERSLPLRSQRVYGDRKSSLWYNDLFHRLRNYKIRRTFRKLFRQINYYM